MMGKSFFGASNSRNSPTARTRPPSCGWSCAPTEDIVMYGVYTESCVEREISALVGLGPKLHLVRDAVAVIGGESPIFHEKLQQEGVDLISFDELKLQMLN